jgi:hypothetical protein
MMTQDLQHPKQPLKGLENAPVSLTSLYHIDLKGDE